MKLQFTKMHGAGNDFVVIDAVRQSIRLSPEVVRRLGDRHLGIGFDQLLIVENAQSAENDFRYRIFNCDGSEVEQCGNGARCFARFVRESGLTDKEVLRVETARGVIVPRIEASGEVTVNMGAPRFRPVDVPFVMAHARASDALANRHVIAYEGGESTLSVVSMGNPHAVIFVSDTKHIAIAHEGAQIERHPAFPARVNVGFAAVLSPEHITLRVWERGVGETLACGTGACAAVVCGIQQGLLGHAVTVDTRGGTLSVKWDGADQPVWMTGPATTVFTGEIDLSSSLFKDPAIA
jgi:diaminopimelate epimerase